MQSTILVATALLTPAAAMVVPAGGKLPPPLSPADGCHTFTYDSVQRRLPLIVEAVIENNPSYPESLVGDLRGLAAEIAAGEPLKPLKAPCDVWDAALAPMLEQQETWFSSPWWLAENYFYKRMLELTDGPMDGADPFDQQKADSLAGAAGAFKAACDAGLTEATELAPLVEASLWGNLADLSLSAGAKLVAPDVASSGSGQADNAGTSSMMLADDTAALCEKLASCKGQEILIVLDNCGLELVLDPTGPPHTVPHACHSLPTTRTCVCTRLQHHCGLRTVRGAGLRPAAGRRAPAHRRALQGDAARQGPPALLTTPYPDPPSSLPLVARGR